MYDNFLNQWNGKRVEQYGGECVAGIAEYEAENNLPIVWGNAYQWINNPVMLTAYDWIYNDPNDYNQLPSRGDIIIWDQGLQGSGDYGHIAFFDAYLHQGAFQSFGQNWGGKQMHFQTHTWANVAGWYKLKPVEQIPAPAPTPDPVQENIPPEPVIESLPGLINLPSGALPITSPRYEHEIVKQIPAYETMTDAQNRQNPTDVVSPGTNYYLRTSQGGMDKLATDSSGANAIWINPALNVPDPTPEQAVKTTLEDIKKQWTVTVSPPNNPVLITPASPPLPTVADNSWKSMSPFINQAGKRIAREYRVVKAYQVTDLEGRTDKRVALIPGQRILIAGTFQKDGIKYFRPKKVADAGGWWGIPLVDPSGDDIIELDKPLVFTVPTPDFVLTPQRKIAITEALADGKAAFDKFESRLGLRVFDIFRHKK